MIDKVKKFFTNPPQHGDYIKHLRLKYNHRTNKVDVYWGKVKKGELDSINKR